MANSRAIVVSVFSGCTEYSYAKAQGFKIVDHDSFQLVTLPKGVSVPAFSKSAREWSVLK